MHLDLESPRITAHTFNGDHISPAPPPPPLGVGLLARVLDALDHGILLVMQDGRVGYVNKIAACDQDRDLPLHWSTGELRTCRPADSAVLQRGLVGALRHGTQCMVTLGGGSPQNRCVSIMPLRDAIEGSAALVILGKRRVCEELGTDAFARLHDLTIAETRVLKLLCSRCRPRDIAVALGVKLSTVRTQIGSIRQKTRARDIGELVYRVSLLPPLPGLMRGAN